MKLILQVIAFQCVLCFLGMDWVLGQDLVINEIMSDNKSTIQDAEGDFCDWVELYNRGTVAVNLDPYYLSDDCFDKLKWSFPSIILLPGSSLVIFASSKDRYTQGEVHTNFRIDADGEEVILSDINGIIDQFQPVRLDEDEVYERFPDGSSNCLVSVDPTPGSSNIAFNQLVFSAESGFHKKPFYLKVNSLSGDTVYYSLDIRAPKPDTCFFPDSLFFSYRDTVANYYSEFITTSPELDIGSKAWKSPDILLDKAHVLRCASFRNGIRTSNIYTQTYFVDSMLEGKYDLPIISLVTEHENLFDYDSGIYVPGVHFNPEDPWWTGNYYQRGDGWERPVHVEYYDEHGVKRFSQDAGLRIHGGKSRIYAQKSLRLYARDKYGKDNFNYRLLPHRSNTKYERFVLQSTMGSWNGNTVISDVFAHNIVSNLNIDYQDYQPVIVFINGEYWGIQTIRDKLDERYIAYTHHCDKDSINLIQGNYRLIQAGTNENYLELAVFIGEHDLSKEENYNYVRTQIDIDNFIDYLVAEMYFSNADWPQNNQKLWQQQENNSQWRWILFDMDACFGSYNRNMIERSLEWVHSSTWVDENVSTYIFNNLLNNNGFKTAFLNRYAAVLRTTFTTNVMENKLNSIKEKYDAEMPRHIKRWHFPGSFSEWETDILENIATYIQERPCYIEQEIKAYFDEDEFGFSCHEPTDFSDSIILAPNPNDGNFFICNKGIHDFMGHLIIMDYSGTIIHIDDYLYLEAGERKHYCLTGLRNGLYILRLSSETLFASKKMLILK